MEEDTVLLRAVLGNPRELTTWLAYADWLDEHDDPLAEFIRLEIRREELPDADPDRLAIRARLDELRRGFDPNWVAVFDRPPIENCLPPRTAPCPGRWDALRGTARPDVRHCGTCRQDVYFCHDIESARERTQPGDRVAVRLGLWREPNDLFADDYDPEGWVSLFTDPRLRLRPDRPALQTVSGSP